MQHTRLAKRILKTNVLSAGAFVLLSASTLSNALDINVSGYLKADFIYDLDQDLGDELAGNTINTDPSADDAAHFRAHARQSRLALSVKHNDYDLRVEGDFFGGGGNETVSNSRPFRIRHAVAKRKNLTIGQTWSTFMDRDFSAFPNTADFSGPAGLVFARQALLRWKTGDLELAIENPESTFRGDAGSTSEEPLPDFVARYARAYDNAYFYVSGVVQSTKVEGGAADGESASYLGASFGGSYQFNSGAKFSATTTINGGRYSFYGFNNPTFVTVGDDLETVDTLAYTLAYTQKTRSGEFNLIYGVVNFDDEYAGDVGSTLTNNDAEKIRTIHVNYLYNVTKSVVYMFELSNRDREDYSGNSNDNTRIQFSAQYKF